MWHLNRLNRKKGHRVAMTNCKTIWFPHKKKMVKKIQNDNLSKTDLHWFAHELQHVQQCIDKGGKRNYAKMWFGEMPKTWVKLLLNGKPDDIKDDGLHDAMPMEKNADKKADKVQKAFF